MKNGLAEKVLPNERFTKKYCLILICLSLFIVGGNALSIELFGVVVRLGEIFSVLCGVFFIKDILYEKVQKTVKIILIWTLLSIFLILINSMYYGFTLRDTIIGALYLFRFVYLIVFAYVVSRYIINLKMEYGLLKFVNGLYLIVCFIGFFQLAFYPVAFDWYGVFLKFGVNWVENADPHIARLVSTDFDPNYLASCLLIGISVDLILLRRCKQKYTCDKQKYKKELIFSYCSLGIYLITILLTKSRSGIVGVAVVALIDFLFYVVKSKTIKVKYIILACSVFLVAIYLLLFSDIKVFSRIREVFENTDPSAKARFSSWEKGFEIVKQTCFMGIGFNMFGPYNQMFYGVTNPHVVSGLDSSLELVVVTTGLVGLVLFVWHFALFLKSKNVLSELKALILAAAIISNFNNLLFYGLWVFPFYLVVFVMELSTEKRDLSDESKEKK